MTPAILKMKILQLHATDQIHLAFRSHVDKVVNGKEKITHPTSRQCPFCKKKFPKSVENMNKNTKICAPREGITYTFDNGDIISFQDNFKNMENVPFAVYFDFETTASNAVFLTQKCMLCPTVRHMLSTLV